MKLDANHFYTTDNLFEEIVGNVKEKLPKNLDYYCANYETKNILNYEFSPEFVLSPGSSEGYYLDLGIYGAITQDKEREHIVIGTFKTLGTDDETIREMAALYAECLIAYDKITNEHLDDMTRIGYDVDFYKGKKWQCGFSGCKTEERAKERAKEIFGKDYGCTKAILRNNLTRKEKIIEGE